MAKRLAVVLLVCSAAGAAWADSACTPGTEFEPDFFFDDQTGHIENAAAHVPAGHVASGISNP